jgi:hypothetical protein
VLGHGQRRLEPRDLDVGRPVVDELVVEEQQAACPDLEPGAQREAAVAVARRDDRGRLVGSLDDGGPAGEERAPVAGGEQAGAPRPAVGLLRDEREAPRGVERAGRRLAARGAQEAGEVAGGERAEVGAPVGDGGQPAGRAVQDHHDAVASQDVGMCAGCRPAAVVAVHGAPIVVGREMSRSKCELRHLTG